MPGRSFARAARSIAGSIEPALIQIELQSEENVTGDPAAPRFIRGDCQEDCTRQECKASDQKTVSDEGRNCSCANPIRHGSRFEKDATRLHAEPLDTGRTRSAAALDGAELH